MNEMNNGGDAPVASRRRAKWVVPVAAGCAVLVLAGAGGGYAWYAHDRSVRVLADANEACSSSVAAVKDAKKDWESVLVSDEVTEALKITDRQVAQTRTVSALAETKSTSFADVKACSGDADTLHGITDANTRLASTYEKQAAVLKDDARTVTASRDAKTLADLKAKLDGKVKDARKLLADSDGKVKDAKTRDTLSKAISEAGKAKDAKTIETAIGTLDDATGKVNTSIDAKQKSDAAAKAKAEAAKQAATQTGAGNTYTNNSNNSNNSNNGYGYGYTGGGNGNTYTPTQQTQNTTPAPTTQAPQTQTKPQTTKPQTSTNNKTDDSYEEICAFIPSDGTQGYFIPCD
ncbi:hypothetical protein [Bifidobacterium jacchi]|uniref:Colicin transporter n=1 Tax=Bifidobacterium jacchi TaxID=2490545 RepID=A0A5N5RJU1_9BIFI|nr:hypothetical protein [Bifidobacterium jacchi]KAB5607572.1 hypothetical protein EHS19_04480 [Bifidobacterium jacchi]